MTTDAVGGVWRYSLDLAAGLTQHGAQVLLAVLGPGPTEEQIKQAAALSVVTLRTSDFALEWMPDPWKDVDASGEWLLDLQKSYRADVIHLNGYCHARLPWYAPVLVTAHSCVYSWWRAVHGTHPGSEWGEYWRRVSDGLGAADAVVCPSEFMARAIQGEYGTALEKIRVLHNFAPDAVTIAHRDKQPFFLGAGRVWDPAKNFQLLDQVAAKLEWEIRVAGGNQSPDGSQRDAKHLELLGVLDHARLLHLMNSAAVFVHPALYEPFGLSVLEAAQAHCALVLADIPSLRELWDGAAVFANPRDPEAWAFELNRLSRDAEKREHLAAAAYSQAGRYGAGTSITAYLGLYEGLSAEASKRRDESRRGTPKRAPQTRTPGMRVAMFYHSLVSDWNHGNAHFLRGVASELQARGHEVTVFEPEDAWSRVNLVQQYGDEAIRAFRLAFPNLAETQYRTDALQLDRWLNGVDLVLVHEWNHPDVISAMGRYRRRNPNIRILFHDTHHRALTARDELARFDLSHYDGVLAYGASLKETYMAHGWGKQVFVWHEAADTRTFYPRASEEKAGDVIWIGNWGDDERTEELREYFIDPVKRLKLKAQVYGVRYPEHAIRELSDANIDYGGWLPNFEVPARFAQFRATVHVPRRPYARELAGIPTIRPFEALACGIPLVSAPWQDTEGLFRVGTDFLMVPSGAEMERALRDVLANESLARNLGACGLETIRKRHTCAHRVDELLAIYEAMRPATFEPLPAEVHS